MGRDGVEPPEPKATDLQSVPLPLTVYLPMEVTRGVEPLLDGLLDRCITNYATQPIKMAGVENYDIPPAVLETAILPLY